MHISFKNWRHKALAYFIFFYCSPILANTGNVKKINTLEDEIAYLKAESSMNYTVVSSSKIEQSVNDAPSVITAYNEEDIARLGARTLSDVLMTVPGMQVEMNSNGRQKVWIRGIQSEDNQKVLVYLDGVPFRNTFSDFSIDDELPLNAVKRIEIIRGPGGSLYGANAFSGVINLYSYKPGERNKNILKAEVGNQDTHSGYFALDQNLGVAKVMLDGKILHTNGTTPLYDNKGNPDSRSRKEDMNFLRLKTGFFNNELILTGYLGEFKNQRADVVDTVDNQRRHQNIYGSLSYQHEFTDKIKLESMAYYVARNRYETENIFSSSAQQQLTNSTRYYDNTGTFDIRNYLNFKPSKTNTLVSGFEVDHNYLNNTITDNVTGQVSTSIVDPQYRGLSYTNYGVLIQDTQSFFQNKLSFTSGLRYDFLQLFSNQLTYRLGLVYNFTPEIFSKLLYATAFRSPANQEFTRAPLGAARPSPETVKTIEAQIGYQTKNARYTLTGYRNLMNQVISRSNQVFPVPVQYSPELFLNVGSEETYGVEFESKFILSKQLEGFLNATWLRAINIDTGLTMPLLANWTMSLGVDWHKKVGIGELFFDNNVVVYGKRTDWSSYIWNPGQQQRYPNWSPSFTDGFAIWNLSLRYKMLEKITKGLTVGVIVHNVLDTVYYSQNFVVPAPNQPAVFDNQYDRRLAILNFSYEF